MSKQAARHAKDLLTLCLARGIDESLAAYIGPRWFYVFLQDDQTQDPKFQIARNGQTSVRDLDLQALLKILRYREKFADLVFAYYGFANSSDTFDNHTQKRQIRSLLDRLITDFRNQIDAHNRVADIEQDMLQGEKRRIYGYQEALQDMTKLSSIFSSVRDSRGRTYHSQIAALCKPKRRLWWIPVTAAAVVILSLGLYFIFVNPPKEKDSPTVQAQGETDAPTTGNVFYNPQNVVFTPDKVSIRPTHIYYEGSQLVAKCLVLNGTDKTICNIQVNKLTITDNVNHQRVAQAAFDTLPNLTIQSNAYAEWTFCFPAETLLSQDADLTKASITSDLDFNH